MKKRQHVAIWTKRLNRRASKDLPCHKGNFRGRRRAQAQPRSSNPPPGTSNQPSQQGRRTSIPDADLDSDEASLTQRSRLPTPPQKIMARSLAAKRPARNCFPVSPNEMDGGNDTEEEFNAQSSKKAKGKLLFIRKFPSKYNTTKNNSSFQENLPWTQLKVKDSKRLIKKN